MSNVIATPDVFANTGLVHLKNNLVLAKKVSSQFTDEFRKVGTTVRAKRHPEFVVREGRVADVQDVLEGEVTVRLDTQAGVDVKFTSFEETLTVDSLLKSKVMESAMSQLAQYVDTALFRAAYRSTYNWAGTAGQTINSALDFFEGPALLTDLAVPTTDRHSVIYSREGFALAGSFTGGASTSIPSDIAKNAIQQATIPMIAGIDPVMSQSVPLHTAGAWAGDALVKGADQNVSYSTASVRNTWTQGLLIDDLTNLTTVKVGDVITFTDVYAVNPRTRESTGRLQEFVVRPGTNGSGGYVSATKTDGSEDVDNGTYTFSTGGSSEMTIQISPPIIISGAYQTVTKAPDNDSAITVKGGGGAASRMNLCFHRSAYALCMAKLEMPFTGEASIATDPETGLSVRYWRYSDGRNDEHNHRYDVLFGATCLDGRLAARQSGLS